MMWDDLGKYLRQSDRRFLVDEKKLKGSYSRSIHAGVNPNLERLTDVVTGEGLQKIQFQYDPLQRAARDLFEETYSKLSDKSCAFVLTDPEARILELYSCPEVIEECLKRSVKRGASLAEERCGTNAVALALYYQDTIVLRGAQHFCKLFRDWCCVAVPIFDREDQPLGCIDCSMSYEASLGEKLPLLQMLAEKLVSFWSEHDARPSRKVTQRRWEIIELLSKGYSSKQVAYELKLNPRTVETHLRRMREQWNAKTTCELVTKILNSGATPVKPWATLGSS
jgi:transcriptional regulator of acetoin/glycerol metabolism